MTNITCLISYTWHWRMSIFSLIFEAIIEIFTKLSYGIYVFVYLYLLTRSASYVKKASYFRIWVNLVCLCWRLYEFNMRFKLSLVLSLYEFKETIICSVWVWLFSTILLYLLIRILFWVIRGGEMPDRAPLTYLNWEKNAGKCYYKE